MKQYNSIFFKALDINQQDFTIPVLTFRVFFNYDKVNYYFLKNMPGPGPSAVETSTIVKAIIAKPDAVLVGTGDFRQMQAAENVNKQRFEQSEKDKQLRAPPKKPVYGTRIEENNKSLIVPTRENPAGGVRTPTPEQQTRLNNLNIETELVQAFLEKGYEGLKNTDPAKTAQIIRRVEAELRLRPGLSDALENHMTPVEKAEFLVRVLNNPNFIQEMQANFESGLNNVEIRGEQAGVKQAYETAQAEYNAAQANYDGKKKDFDEYTQVQKNLEDYSETNGKPVGAKAKRIQELTQSQKTDAKKVEDLTKKNTDLDNRLQAIETALGLTAADFNTDPAYLTLKSEKSFIEKDLKAAKKRLQELKKLQDNKKDLINRRNDLQKRKANDITQSKLDLLEKQANDKKPALDKAIQDMAQLETEIVAGYSQVIETSTGNWLDKEIETVDTALQTEIEKLKAAAVNETEKEMYGHMQSRWLGEERVRYKGFLWSKEEKYRPVDKDKVDDDFNKLRGEGPDAYMKRMVFNMLKSRQPPLTLDTTQLDQWMVDNKDLVDKMQPVAVEQLLSRKILTGGLTPEDVHIIVNSNWGGGVIDGAIAKNKQFREAVEKIAKEGGLSRHSYLERVGQVLNKSPWLLLGAFAVASSLTEKEEDVSS